MSSSVFPVPLSGIQEGIIDAKGDLITATAADTPARLAVGTNEQRLVADSAAATGLKYVADTTNYAIAAKGDLLVGTAADTLNVLSVGTNGHILTADSSVSPQGLKWAVDPVADVITTAGDLIYGTAADTVARLGIGTASQVLAVNSGATAPEWVTPAGGGAVKQVVSSNSTTSQTITSTSYTDVTGLSVAITPSSTSNKIVIMMGADVGIARAGSDRAQTNYQILRGATVLTESAAYHIGDDGEVYDGGYQGFIIYDSPATTSATTYKIQGKINTPDESQSWGDYAYIIAMEVV